MTIITEELKLFPGLLSSPLSAMPAFLVSQCHPHDSLHPQDAALSLKKPVVAHQPTAFSQQQSETQLGIYYFCT